MASLNVFALVFCFFLYLKGIFFPSGADSGSTGNFVFDYYWGTELYPRILGWDVKMWTNCRFGMMGWPLLLLCFVDKQMQLRGSLGSGLAVSVIIQLIYITKFFWWETGYLSSIDIMHDRAGFYICWGCMAFLPCVYTAHSLFLVEHAPELSNGLALAILAFGVFSVFINYDSDRQRQQFRANNGNYTIWGKKARKLVAKYRTEKGEERESLLLLSGYWSWARHFHYVPEIAASLAWCMPALTTAALPYFYAVPYLCLLLTDRAFRDDARCKEKYGKYWEQYCRAVPFKIIPGVL